MSDSGSELDFESRAAAGSSRANSLEGTLFKKLEEAKNLVRVRAVLVGAQEVDDANREVAAELEILLEMKGPEVDFAVEARACSEVVLILCSSVDSSGADAIAAASLSVEAVSFSPEVDVITGSVRCRYGFWPVPRTSAEIFPCFFRVVPLLPVF